MPGCSERRFTVMFFQTAHVLVRGCFNRARKDQNFQPFYAHRAQSFMPKIYCAISFDQTIFCIFIVNICYALFSRIELISYKPFHFMVE